MPELEKGKSIQIFLKSVPESVNEVEVLVDKLSETTMFSEDSYGNILISLTEAVNNAIIHGNGRNPEKVVTLGMHLSEDGRRLVVMVEDQGKGFDYLKLSDPTQEQNLANESGRGVFLMKQLADMVVFSKGGSSVELHFRL